MLMGPLPALLGFAQQYHLLPPMKMTVIIGFPVAVGMVPLAWMLVLAPVTTLQEQTMLLEEYSAGQ